MPSADGEAGSKVGKWEQVEPLVRQLLDVDARRVAVVVTCGDDWEKGIRLTRPIVAEHKLLIAQLRAILDEPDP